MPCMQTWLHNTRQQIQKGETLIASSVAVLFRGWQHPAIVIDKLCTGAERWQAAVRETPHVPMDLAEILRTRPHLSAAQVDAYLGKMFAGLDEVARWTHRLQRITRFEERTPTGIEAYLDIEASTQADPESTHLSV